MMYVECDNLEDWDGFPEEADPEPDDQLAPCQCEFCPCTQLTRHIKCADCIVGVHQG